MASEKTMVEALELAEAAHRGQVDKAGMPYIGHLIRVAVGAYRADWDEAAFVVGVLHDIVEDQDYSVADIEDRFGPEVAAAVDAVTHRPGERRVDYLHRVAANRLATVVKRADFTDNADPVRMAAITDEATRSRLEAKYAEGVAVLGGLAALR